MWINDEIIMKMKWRNNDDEEITINEMMWRIVIKKENDNNEKWR